ncbi:MAG: PIN domain-containing protein [Bryobacteraceae bacterium]
MDRLFLDANVLFSAAYREESGLLQFWQLKRVVLLTSPCAIDEARRNLEEGQQRERLAQLVRTVELVHTLSVEGIPLLPPKDQPILRAAISGKATHLITGDVRHFGKLYETRVSGVLVVTPAMYLKNQR